MNRFLVAFRGPQTEEWLFLGLVAHVSDAVTLAMRWRNGVVFDLMHYAGPQIIWPYEYPDDAC